MKRIRIGAILLALSLCLFIGGSLAAEDPIVCTMEISPEKLSGPGQVNVTINISNSGDTDMRDPLVLYNPVGTAVEDFGEKGAVILKAGESKTWTGTWDVNQRMLDNGSVLYYIKYNLYDENGKAQESSQPIRARISTQEAIASMEVKRTIAPSTARNGQVVTVKYDIVNTGGVPLLNVTIQEHKDIQKDAQTVAELKPGETAQITFPVTMGKKDLTSSATISYQTENSSKRETQEVEAQKIIYGEPSMTAKLISSAKGAEVNGKVTLTLELKNTGTVDYSNLRVEDGTLGEVFSNQSLPKGETLKLEKEITLPGTMDYQFVITAIDNTGTEVSLSTDSLTLTAVDPGDVLHLAVSASADRTEVYEQPGNVRFSVTVTNDSNVDAKEVDLLHGETKIYTFSSIPAGQSRSISRDTALSMPGKYQFTVTTKDALDNTLTFPGNEINVAFSLPTPAPATPTPVANPTAIPTFHAQTMVPIGDKSIGAFPKLIQSILLPVLIIGGVLMVAAVVLLLIATKRRMEQKKASEAAYDHLERAKRRDYAAPATQTEADQVEVKGSKTQFEDVDDQPLSVSESRYYEEDMAHEDVEFPHMKYVRDAYESSRETPDDVEKRKSTLFDDENLLEDEDYVGRHRSRHLQRTQGYDDYAQYEDGVDGNTSNERQLDYESEFEGYNRPYDEAYDELAYEEDYGENQNDLVHDDSRYGVASDEKIKGDTK